MTRTLATQQPPAAASVRAWRWAWMLGWATAAIARVHDTEASAEATADDRDELAIVLRDRVQAVRRRASEAHPCTRTTRETTTGYDAGYSQGHGLAI